jgi:hypothetical protein
LSEDEMKNPENMANAPMKFFFVKSEAIRSLWHTSPRIERLSDQPIEQTNGAYPSSINNTSK